MMKIAFLILLLSAVTGHSQNVYEFGKNSYSVPHLLDVRYLDSMIYRSYILPQKPEIITDQDFSVSHLKEPHLTIQSYLIATNSEWLGKVCLDSAIRDLSPQEAEFRMKKSKSRNYLFEVFVDLTFRLDANLYHISLVRYEYDEGETTLIPIPCIKTSQGWLITAKPQITELAMFLLLKPEVFDMMVRGESVYPSEAIYNFKKEYLYSTNILRTDKSFGIKALTWQVSRNPEWKDILILNDSLPIDKALELNTNNVGSLGIASLWTNKTGNCYSYDPQSFHMFLKTNLNVYDKSPEYALGSWEFSEKSEEKEKNSIGFDKISNELKIHENSHGRLVFNQKYIFYSKNNIYCLFYYELFTGYTDEQGNTREQNLGHQRMLLKWEKNRWYIDFNPEDVIRHLVWVLDKMSPEIIKAGFTNVTDEHIYTILQPLQFYSFNQFIDVHYLYAKFEYTYHKFPAEMKRKNTITNKYESVYKWPSKEGF